MSEQLDPALRDFADTERLFEPRTRGISFRPGDPRTVVLIVTVDAAREVTKRLYDRLKTYRAVNGVDCDVLITNSTTPKFGSHPDIPDGWPPD